MKFQLINLEINYSGDESNDNITNIVNPSITALPRRLDGASNAIIHPGIGIGTTIQTTIYVRLNIFQSRKHFFIL